MPVGNDIVDLRDPDTAPGAIHPRFDIRVFTAAERQRLADAVFPDRVRWTMWAAKESAFKAAAKLHPGVPFHPRKFVVELFESADTVRAEVFHQVAGRFDVWVEEARDWVHAVARPAEEVDGTPPRSALSFLESAASDTSEAGRRVRELATRAIAPLISAPGHELRIVSENGVPRLRRGEDPVPLDISLSHHGRLVACAWSDGTG